MYLEIGLPVFETSIEALIGCDWDTAAEGSDVIDSKTIAKTEAAFLALGLLVSRILTTGATRFPLQNLQSGENLTAHTSPICEQALLGYTCHPTHLKLDNAFLPSGHNGRTIQGMAHVEQQK